MHLKNSKQTQALAIAKTNTKLQNSGLLSLSFMTSGHETEWACSYNMWAWHGITITTKPRSQRYNELLTWCMEHASAWWRCRGRRQQAAPMSAGRICGHVTGSPVGTCPTHADLLCYKWHQVHQNNTTPCSEKKWYICFFPIYFLQFLKNFMKLSNSGINVLQPVFLYEADI